MGLAPCAGLLAAESIPGFPEGRCRSRGRPEGGLGRCGSSSGPNRWGCRVSDKGVLEGGRVGLSAAAQKLTRVNSTCAAGTSSAGPELRFWERAARGPGDGHESSETALRVRDDRSRGVSGLRVGSRKSVSDVRFRRVSPVAAGGAHGDLARGDGPEASAESQTMGEQASRVIIMRHRRG